METQDEQLEWPERQGEGLDPNRHPASTRSRSLAPSVAEQPRVLAGTDLRCDEVPQEAAGEVASPLL